MFFALMYDNYRVARVARRAVAEASRFEAFGSA